MSTAEELRARFELEAALELRRAELDEIAEVLDEHSGCAAAQAELLAEIARLEARIRELEGQSPPDSPTPPAPPSEPTYIFRERWEALPDSDTWELVTPTPHSEHVKRGREATATESGTVLVTIDSDQPTLSPPGTPLDKITLRSELAWRNGTGKSLRAPLGEDRWYSVRIRLQPNWQPKAKFVITQWHGDVSDGQPPVVSLTVWGRLAYLRTRYEGSGGTIDVWTRPMPELIGQWLHLAVWARWGYLPEHRPALRAWIDGSLVHEREGPNIYDQRARDPQHKGPYFHWGAYAPSGRDGAPWRNTIELEEFRVGDSDNKLADFMP